MIMKILIALAVVVLVVLGLAATKPDSFSVQRSIQIKATPDKIYPLVADFHRWTEWSPWAALPPARWHAGELGHDRAYAVRLDADAGVHQHGQEGRQRLRGRAGQAQGSG